MDDTKTAPNKTPKAGGWQIAAVALAAGQSGEVAAAAAGVALSTIKRWRRVERFRQKVEEYRAAIVDEALGRLTANTTKASDALVALLASPNEQTRLQAAKCVLDYRAKLRADGELTARLNELEKLVQEILPHVGVEANPETNQHPAPRCLADGESGEDEAVEGRDDRRGDCGS